MISLVAYSLFFGVLAALVWKFRRATHQACHRSSVSSLPDARFRIPKSLRRATWGGPLVACVALGAGLIAQAPLWIGALILVTYAIGHGFLVQAIATSARRSSVMRYIAALSHPDVKAAKIALYFTEPRLLTPYQVTMWLDPLLSLDEHLVIVLKERKHLRHFPQSDRYTVLVASEMPLSMSFLPEATKLLFFVNNSMANLDVIKNNPDVTHIQLLHGDSDKPPSYNPMSSIYDYLFVAGEMAIDRYARNDVTIAPEKFKIVGRPQLSVPQHRPQERKTIVYMSTWAGMFEDSNFCSLPQAHDIVRHSLNSGHDIDLVFKPHPVSFRDASWPQVQAKIAKATANLADGVSFRLAAHDEDPFALYAMADVLITDISSTVIDFLYTGKPYIVTNPRNYSDSFLETFPSVSGGYLATPDASNLADLLSDCFGQDHLSEARAHLQSYAFGDFGRPQGAAFKETCEALLNPTTAPRADAPSA